MRLHEQLKMPTTPEHDRACATIMSMPIRDTVRLLGLGIDEATEFKYGWHPEEPVREAHRGNLVGFVDLLLTVSWETKDGDSDFVERHRAFAGIEVKTAAELKSIGSAVRQVKTYRGGLVMSGEHIPTQYGLVSPHAGNRLTVVALAVPVEEASTDEAARVLVPLTKGVPLLLYEATPAESAALDTWDPVAAGHVRVPTNTSCLDD